MLTDSPTYSFEEVIELIRNADGYDHLRLIHKVVIDDKYKYCLYHLALISEAVELKVGYLAKDPQFR